MKSVDLKLKHFYIPEEQSIYLLSHKDAQKLKDWLQLCTEQLELMGYRNIEMIGSGAHGFAFAGRTADNEELVFKFSRITLPQHIQDRLEEEAYMLQQVEHRHVPSLVAFERIRNQAIMVMERASGIDLDKVSLERGPLPARLVIKIAAQLAEILISLRQNAYLEQHKPLVHGDIKPSNIVLNEKTEEIGLVDWGSSVFAQLDHRGKPVSTNVMDLMSGDINSTNARLGDIYFIGDEQLNGGLSSSRFDEQGVAGTLYALASGQSCRFGHHVITPESLCLPIGKTFHYLCIRWNLFHLLSLFGFTTVLKVLILLSIVHENHFYARKVKSLRLVILMTPSLTVITKITCLVWVILRRRFCLQSVDWVSTLLWVD